MFKKPNLTDLFKARLLFFLRCFYFANIGKPKNKFWPYRFDNHIDCILFKEKITWIFQPIKVSIIPSFWWMLNQRHIQEWGTWRTPPCLIFFWVSFCKFWRHKTHILSLKSYAVFTISILSSTLTTKTYNMCERASNHSQIPRIISRWDYTPPVLKFLDPPL